MRDAFGMPLGIGRLGFHRAGQGEDHRLGGIQVIDEPFDAKKGAAARLHVHEMERLGQEFVRS